MTLIFHGSETTVSGLLNIGEMGALALHLMVELAALKERDPDARLAVRDVAEKLNASAHTLHKVTRRLVMAGLAEGMRGAGGGLVLTADPAIVTMRDIIEAVDGKIATNGCLFAKRVCPAETPCAFQNITGVIEQKLMSYLSTTTLAELVKCAGCGKHRNTGLWRKCEACHA